MPSLRPTKNFTPTPAYLVKSPSIDLGTVGLYFGMSYSTATEWCHVGNTVCSVIALAGWMASRLNGVARCAGWMALQLNGAARNRGEWYRDLMAPRRQRDSAHWSRGRSHYRRYVWTCWRESPPIDLDGLYSDMECCTATRQVHAESKESPHDERRGERHLVSQWEDGKLGEKWRRTRGRETRSKVAQNSPKTTTN